MSSTEFNVGLPGAEKASSRILKPPGGGHHDIFGAPEQKINNPRPKYDQQNSSNLNSCMNTTDPNVLLEQAQQIVAPDANIGSEEPVTVPPPARSPNNITGPPPDQVAPSKGRVPPGGYSSGLW